MHTFPSKIWKHLTYSKIDQSNLFCGPMRQATLTIQPQTQPGVNINVNMTRPTSASIIEKVRAGDLQAHPSREPLDKKWITTAMNTIQRQLMLKTGANGQWTPDAQQRFESLMSSVQFVKEPCH